MRSTHQQTHNVRHRSQHFEGLLRIDVGVRGSGKKKNSFLIYDYVCDVIPVGDVERGVFTYGENVWNNGL